MAQLKALIDAELGADADLAVLHTIHGSADADEIAASIEVWCRANLAADVVDAWLWRVSVGCVSGVRLDDERNVVIKVYSSDRSAERISRVLDAQRHASAAGIPAALPICGPRPLALGLATAEAALRVGRPAIFSHDLDRRTAAHGWYAVSRAFGAPSTWCRTVSRGRRIRRCTRARTHLRSTSRRRPTVRSGLTPSRARHATS